MIFWMRRGKKLLTPSTIIIGTNGAKTAIVTIGRLRFIEKDLYVSSYL